MKIYIPVEAVKTTNFTTDKPFELNTSTKEDLKCDDMIVLDSNALLDSIVEEIENYNVDRAFVNKLLKVLGECEDFQSLIIKRGLDLAAKCAEDPESAVFAAAKKLWTANYSDSPNYL